LSDPELAARLHQFVKHGGHGARMGLLTTREWTEMDLADPKTSCLNPDFVKVLHRRLRLVVHGADGLEEDNIRMWKNWSPEEDGGS